MPRRDNEEEDIKHIPEDPPVISTPHDRRNGRKWWQETWGKAVGTVLGGVLLALTWWTWGLAVAFKAATVEVYSLPPMVSAHENRLRAIDARLASPMPQAEVERFAQAVALALAKQKGKP